MRISTIVMVLFSILGSVAHATSDGNTRVALVVQNVNAEEGDPAMFMLERAPLIGCYGTAQGPQLLQWTSEYKVPTNIGCGGIKAEENINALTCARVTDSKENSTYTGFSEITLDISGCAQKNNPQFITMIRTSAAINFPQSDSKKQVKLNIIK